MSKANVTVGDSGIFDAKQLGVSKMLILGVQHMFAMFGATVIVPALTGLDVSTTLLFAGLGTLLFHFLAKERYLHSWDPPLPLSQAMQRLPLTERRSFSLTPALVLPVPLSCI